ncbi:quinone oxidoreductase family protein [Pyxidicoccus xibeiensis]|uniref:quinone oxidoreductase family protein n=1 Tax=Pyxidicoccus xibeiensis TaxID=2906759 RepID=UPI0020A74D41|nr:zinc-binding dehydrogenase [Pyxidicoccus xibeiensis]MCP3137925.1 zinc-binding dehydrogenase [Pyxidicoccus xibeiensis]
MKALVFDRIGSPLEVLQLREVPVPEVGEGHVLVRMVSASINPGDFLFIQSLYPEPAKPVLPGQIAGNHGAGIVARVGRGVSLEPGTLVAFSHVDTWAEYVVVPSERLIPLPPDYPLEKAAQFFNLISAWDLLEESRVQPGQWLALTAGNSTVATMLLQLARARGVKVVSLVRRVQPRLDLKALGASEVLELSGGTQGVGQRLLELTGGQGVSGIIDCVGGPLLGELIRSSAFGGQVIVYGGYSAQKFELHNFDILMKGLRLGAYVYRYFFEPPKPEDLPMLRNIAALSAPASFKVPIAEAHSLEDFKSAIEESVLRPEAGKRFFKG